MPQRRQDKVFFLSRLGLYLQDFQYPGSPQAGVIIGRSEGPRTSAAELGPALFAVFPVNRRAETAGFWVTIQPGGVEREGEGG